MSNASSEPAKPRPAAFPAHWPHVSWGPSAAVIVAILAYLGAQYLALIILGVVHSPDQSWLRHTTGQFYFVLASNILILTTLWLFLRKRSDRVTSLGLGRRPVWLDLGYAALGYLIYFGILVVVLNLVGALTPVDLEQKQELGFDKLLSSTEKLLALASLVIMPPIVEEIVFRGFVFAGMRRKLRFASATIITSLLFAGPHLLASSEGLLWVAGIDTFVLSLVLCYLREKTAGLWAPIAVHAIKNSVAFIFLITSASMLY